MNLAGDAAEGVRLPAAALLVADTLPASDPQKKVVTAYKRDYEGRFKQRRLDLRRPCLRRADARGRGDQARRLHRQGEGARRPRSTRGYIGTAGVVNMAPTDHMGLDLPAFRMLEVRKGDWVLVK